MHARRLLVLACLILVVVAAVFVPQGIREYRLYAMLAAAGSGITTEVMKLIADGAPINGHFGGDGETPLHRAAAAGHIGVVKSLLDAGADPNAVNEQNSSALLFAVFRGHLDVAVAVLDAGADPNIAESRYGATPLIEAARNGDFPMVKLLIARGASVGTKDRSGETAADKAKAKGQSQILAVLSGSERSK